MNKNWKKYLFEFLSIFFAVIFAFTLNKWNENRKDHIVENKILIEISNGLKRDSLDLANDERSYELNMKAIKYFRKLINNIEVENDSLSLYYFFLTRDYVTVQNTSGYETLKSKGLETVKNDSLRKNIIDLYEVTYKLHQKFTEDYDENKYMKNYFEKINNAVAPNFSYDSKGNIIGIQQPLNLNQKDANIVNSYLWRLQMNRNDRLSVIKTDQKIIGAARKSIQENIE